MSGHTETDKHRQTQTDRQTDRQTDTATDTDTDTDTDTGTQTRTRTLCVRPTLLPLSFVSLVSLYCCFYLMACAAVPRDAAVVARPWWEGRAHECAADLLQRLLFQPRDC